MKLLEYQAKELLNKAGIRTAGSQLIRSANTEISLNYPIVLKVQVPIGGRGKAGGIKKANNAKQAAAVIKELLKLNIKGHNADSILAETEIKIEKEFYLSFTIDRASQSAVIIAHARGGIEIEEQNKENLATLNLSLSDEELSVILMDIFKLPDDNLNKLKELIEKTREVFVSDDALLIEINPLAYTKQKILVPADAKIVLDDNARFRHDNWNEYGGQTSAQFVILNRNGNVACIANGAGLAMATVDAESASGLKPANFLDVGGGSSTESMVEAFNKISELKNIRSIIINIFAGITRCDEVADAIVKAKSQTKIPPLFIRLYGTNQKEGLKILKNAGIKTLDSLDGCIKEAKNAAA